MSDKPVFLFVFANDAVQSLKLDEEWRQAEKALQDDEDAGRLIFNLAPSVTYEDIFDKFNRFHKQIAIFHYGGHSDGQSLNLVDRPIKNKSLATLIGQEENLKLVFLNGCSNAQQVDVLFKAGVPAVIATTLPINDNKAINFSKQFYNALTAGRTIGGAFDIAAEYINNEEKEVQVAYRSLAIEDQKKKFEWGLYVNNEAVLDWKIPTVKTEKVVAINNGANLVKVSVIAGILIGIVLLIFFGRTSGTVTVKVKIQNDIPLPPKGKVYLSYGNAQIGKEINNNTEAIFTEIPNEYFEKNNPVTITFNDPQGEPYYAVYQDSIYQLEYNRSIELLVALKGLDKLYGIVKDFKTGDDIEGARVSVLDLETVTDINGWWELQIKEAENIRKFHTLRVKKEGYRNWEQANIPAQTEKEIPVLLRSKHQ